MSSERAMNQTVSRRPAIVAVMATVFFAACLAAAPVAGQECFLRSDANADGAIDASDVVCVLRFLFGDGSTPCARPGCLDALDVNDDVEIDLGDPVYLLFHLFRDGPPPPDSFRLGCGPAGGESLGCLEPTPCALPSLTLDVADDLVLHAVWSSAHSTVDAQMRYVSVLRLAPGRQVFGERCESRPLVQSLLVGPGLPPAEATGEVTSEYIPGGCEHWRYSEAFRTRQGPARFRFNFDTCDYSRVEYEVSCCTVGICPGPDRERFFILNVAFDDGAPAIWYSCLEPELWQPSPASARLLLADGTALELHVFDGFSRHLLRARVELRGRTFDIDDYGSLIYAALPEKVWQEYRVLLPEPVDGIHGIDIVECARPPSLGESCSLSREHSRGYYLDAGLARAEELEIAAIEGL